MRGRFAYETKLISYVEGVNPKFVRYKTEIYVNGGLAMTTEKSTIPGIQEMYVRHALPELRERWRRREL